jgi:hypothetical protein
VYSQGKRLPSVFITRKLFWTLGSHFTDFTIFQGSIILLKFFYNVFQTTKARPTPRSLLPSEGDRYNEYFLIIGMAHVMLLYDLTVT